MSEFIKKLCTEMAQTNAENRQKPQLGSITIDKLKSEKQSVKEWFQKFERLTKNHTDAEKAEEVVCHFEHKILVIFNKMSAEDSRSYEKIKKTVMTETMLDSKEIYTRFLKDLQKQGKTVQEYSDRVQGWIYLEMEQNTKQMMKDQHIDRLVDGVKAEIKKILKPIIKISGKTDIETICKAAKTIEDQEAEEDTVAAIAKDNSKAKI